VKPEREEKEEPPVFLRIGAGRLHGLSTRLGSGWGGDSSRLRNYAQKSKRVVLETNRSSNRETVRRLVEIYLDSHGYWQNIRLSPRDPDKRFAGHEAKISLSKDIFEKGEPIPLTLEISEDELDMEAPWWLFSPRFIRVQDEEGKDFPLFTHPVSGGDGVVRSKVFALKSRKTMNLISFIEPYDGSEYVCRFPPGKYKATFH